jgi:beta-glucosidase-like glycosyl hydrolase/CubicO group peptidase (beta-lactamase class C family)
MLLSVVVSAQRKKSHLQVTEGASNAPTESFVSSKEKTSASKVQNNHKEKWVDSVYNMLSMEERIGQLFMVAAYSGGKDYNEPKITELINNHQVGGLIFMQGTPASQAMLTNQFQQAAQVPLLLAMDAEWGLGMRLTGVKDFPRSMLLGATRDSMLVYKTGASIAAQCKRLGVHVNFAPVVDVNNNPNNPVIGARAFGEDKRQVVKMGLAYMNGLQQNGVMACAKHFPGHGDTETDSHQDLPTISKSMQQLDTLELFPFRRLVKEGVKSVMVAHLNVPALDTQARIPTTLSYNTITGLLKNKMKFNGLVFTDALDMKGVAKYYEPGDLELKAFLAGNDVLLFSQNVPASISKIKTAIDSGMIAETVLEASVKKILGAKYDVGLNHFAPIDTTNILTDLNKAIEPIRRESLLKGITLVRDQNHLMNKLTLADAKLSYIGVNTPRSTALLETLRNAIPELRFDFLPKGSNAKDLERINEGMSSNDVNIVAVHGMSFYPYGGSYSLDSTQISFLKSLDSAKNVFYLIMGNPYLLKYFQDAPSVMVAYEDDSIGETIAASMLLRDRMIKGKLPVTPTPAFLNVEEPDVEPEILTQGKRAYALQHVDFKEDAGVTSTKPLSELNAFIEKNIVDGTFPGCRILAAKDGKIFYDEAFGYLDYGKDIRVEKNTLYDVASMTKILATNLAVMKLFEQKKLDLNKTIGDYLSWTKQSNKASLKVRDLLLHQAGLKAWIPFYKELLDEKGNPKTDYFSSSSKKNFEVPVAAHLFLRNDYRDTIWQRILNSSLELPGKYVYSDLDFYFLAAICEAISGKAINEFVEENFYKPLRLKRICYKPLTKKFDASEIAPTEKEQTFRKQTIQGFVHDPGAALFGGVAGHAGVFAQAEDVAVIFQMLLNGGTYKGKRLLSKETISLFTSYQTADSRRGLGFDKPSADKNDGGPASNHCSGYTFGHQGFTGTCGWADPATGVVFVLLSNRVYPTADNNNINRYSIRTTAQDKIYEALNIPVNKSRRELHRQQTKK